MVTDRRASSAASWRSGAPAPTIPRNRSDLVSFTLVLLAIAGAMALTLGVIGIYGVIANRRFRFSPMNRLWIAVVARRGGCVRHRQARHQIPAEHDDAVGDDSAESSGLSLFRGRSAVSDSATE